MSVSQKSMLARLISGHPDELLALPDEQRGDLLILAQQEGVGPVLYWRLSKSGYLSSLPSGQQDFLRNQYAVTWSQNQQIFAELRSLSTEMELVGVPLVLLKGACFALTVYDDVGLRPMGDLDVLVPADKFERALQVVEKLGYLSQLPEAAPGLNALLSHEVFLQKQGLPFALELHHSLVADRAYVYAVPMDWFLQQVEPFAGRYNAAGFGSLQILSAEAQLLYAAAHAMLQHGGHMAPMRWFYDIDLLIRHSQARLDWGLLVRQAQVFEWVSALAAALQICEHYFETPIPEEIHLSLHDLTDRHLDLVRLKQSKPSTHIQLEYKKLKSLDWSSRLKLIGALLFPSPAYMRWRYGFKSSWLYPWYSLMRMLGIFRDVLLTISDLIRRLFIVRFK